MLPTNITYHFCVRRSASDPSEGESSGNKYIFRASPTPPGSLVWKVSAITMTVTEWGIRRGRKRRLSVVRCQAASIAA